MTKLIAAIVFVCVPCLGLVDTACNTPVPVSPINVISDAAACAIDVIEDFTATPTPALLAQTVQQCGIAANDIYQDVSALIRNAQSVDAGTVATRKGVSVVSAVYIGHLQQWEALLSDGGK